MFVFLTDDRIIYSGLQLALFVGGISLAWQISPPLSQRSVSPNERWAECKSIGGAGEYGKLLNCGGEGKGEKIEYILKIGQAGMGLSLAEVEINTFKDKALAVIGISWTLNLWV